MCRKLGKKAKEKLFGKNPTDLRRDKDGKLRRNKYGRVMGENYMARVMKAWSGLNNRLMPDDSTNNWKVRKAPGEHMEKLDNLYLFGQTKRRQFSHSEHTKRVAHLARNFVTRLPMNHDAIVGRHN